MNVLLDTSVIIDWLRQKDSRDTWLFQLLKADCRLFVPVVVVAELYSGSSVWQVENARLRLEGFLRECQIISLEPNSAVLAGRIKDKYKINLIDALVAAEAMERSLKLATLNTRDFAKIEGLELVK
jgi:predicted nucleic acid-binding protein